MIKQLDDATISRIAAGEVIERPASIVKELVENSLDAGATRVVVDIEDGGKKRIIVSDNGSGISKKDMVLAPVRHATSKIVHFEDLYQTDTLGFRGEALASIGHVSEMTITSCVDGGSAYSLCVEEGKTGTLTPCHRDTGTTIDVKDLFHKVPVRLKFLKSKNTELSYITDVVMQQALIHPDIDFVLESDGKSLINTTGLSKLEDVIYALYGSQFKRKLVKVDTHIGPVHFQGFISDPTMTFSNRSKQLVSVNGRPIRNAVLQRALTDSFRDIIPSKRFAFVVLHLFLPQDLLDVNIHPQKTDIKFLEPGFLFDALPKVIKTSLQEHSHLPDSDFSLAPTPQAAAPSSPSPQPSVHSQPSSTLSSAQPLSQISTHSNVESASTIETTSSSRYYYATQSLPIQTAAEPAQTPYTATPTKDAEATVDNTPQTWEYFQIFDTYIVVNAQDSVLLLDQHAVHERVLYEQIKDTYRTLEDQQPLLISEVIEVSPDIDAIFEDIMPQLSALGFEIEPFGPGQMVIREIPNVFSSLDYGSLVLDILDQFKLLPHTERDLILDQKERLQMMACKAAIKAGKRLSTPEIIQLIKDLMNSPSNFTCPHGRPLYIRMDKSDLERLFMRS